MKLIGLMTLIARYCLIAPIKKSPPKAGAGQQNDSDDQNIRDSSDASNDDSEAEDDDGVSREDGQHVPDPTTSSSISILLQTFSSLRTSLAALHSLQSLDFFCDYMYRKAKDNKLPEQTIVCLGRANLAVNKERLLPSKEARLHDSPAHESKDLGMGQMMYR